VNDAVRLMSARDTEAASAADWSFERDLETVFDALGGAWEALRGARIFMTGGTGFIGCWLLETLRFADRRLALDVHVTLLTRNAAQFWRKAPHLAAHPGFTLLDGDVRRFDAPPGPFTHVIHAATDASADLNEYDPRTMFDTVLDGTRRALDLSAAHAARMLFLSSGAVYGRQPWDIEHIAENWLGAPDCSDPRATYGEAKRAAEMLCAIYAKQFGVHVNTARIFSLLGPHLPLSTHFAAGNFIRDAIDVRPIVVNGDGKACRSYLYAADLAAWLWRILLDAPRGRVYNVGSDETVSIGALAQRVATVLGPLEFRILGKADAGWNPGRYVPDTSAIRRDLGVAATVPLDEAIRRTALWNGWKGKSIS
jgi:nucleoside-diphosphate-sugar epimerase